MTELERDLLDALVMMYDRWENGTPCFEDVEEHSGPLGNALRLSFEEENQVLSAIETAEAQRDLLDALVMMYDRWENGTPCFEDVEEHSGPLGNALRLSFEEENQVLSAIETAEAQRTATLGAMTRRNRPFPLKWLEEQCADWNAKYPVGTAVKFFPVTGGEDFRLNRTISSAWVLSGHTAVHTAVIWLDNERRCVALDSCEPIEGSAPQRPATPGQGETTERTDQK